jgi:hypothetical protein
LPSYRRRQRASRSISTRLCDRPTRRRLSRRVRLDADAHFPSSGSLSASCASRLSRSASARTRSLMCREATICGLQRTKVCSMKRPNQPERSNCSCRADGKAGEGVKRAFLQGGGDRAAASMGLGMVCANDFLPRRLPPRKRPLALTALPRFSARALGLGGQSPLRPLGVNLSAASRLCRSRS